MRWRSRRTTRHFDRRLLHRGCGQPRWLSRRGRRWCCRGPSRSRCSPLPSGAGSRRAADGGPVGRAKILGMHLHVRLEQVIDVPSISTPSRCSVRRRWRNSWWKCRLYCLLQCSSSLLASKPSTFLFRLVVVVVVFHGSLPTASHVEQTVDTPAAGRGSSGRLQGFPPRQGSLLVLVEVFTVLSQVRCSVRWHRTTTFLLSVVIFAVFSLHRALTRLVELIITLIRASSRVNTMIMAVFMVRRRRRRMLRTSRTPSSGCNSLMAGRSRPTTGTDAMVRLSGSRRLVSRWCGPVLRIRKGPLLLGQAHP